MSTEIKNTLFRFVTMRAPKLSTEKEIEKKFVIYPKQNYDKTTLGFESSINYQSGFYIDSVNTISTVETKKELLLRVTKEFEIKAIKNKAAILENGFVSENFYDFAIWLTSNRATLKINEVNEHLTQINSIKDSSIISLENEIYLWDNLFYQIISFKSGYLRETIISLLVANFFIKNYIQGDQTNNEYRELAKARVIIPKILLENEEENIIKAIPARRTNKLVSNIGLDNEMSLILNKQKIELYKNAVNELTKVQTLFDKQNQKALEIANKNYQKKIDNIVSKAQIVDRVIIDAITGEKTIVKEYENLKIPPFEYNKKLELNKNFLKDKLSIATQKFVAKLADNNNFDTYQEVLNYIDEELNNITKNIFENANLNKTLVSNNGIVVPVSNAVSSNTNDFSIAGYGYGFWPIMPINLLFNSTFEGASIVSASYKATFENNTFVEATSFENLTNNGNLLVKIFTDGLDTSNNEIINLTGWLDLNNGSRINIIGNAVFSIPTFWVFNGYSISGKGTFKLELKGDNDNSGNLLEYIPSGFGIKRLGIADYRKVEQEICCYVPGEVSHIENIMASEYKERSTRKLRRVEDTTTTTKETETEKLSDSTSTERFEMNQEVASVLAEDTQIGANVTVNQSWGTGDISAGADFANNTSSEESNSQAVSHAKDITERLLDRIVKKTKEERILKVIEEFEENNKHGYDNRANNQHVSGVYRWVDKIYRNQVLNYGKRLIYEFMIPEPATFHNAAINDSKNFKDVEIIIKPIDPRIGDNVVILKSHKDLTEYNYSYWAAVYNAEVNSPQDKIIYVGKSIDYSSTPSSTAYSKSDTVKIPEGYESYSAKLQTSGASPGGTSGWGRYISVIFGDKSFFYTPGWSTQSGVVLIDKYRDSLPIILGTTNHHYANISVNIQCYLTQEAQQQWQIDTFNKIIKAYEIKLSEYNTKLAQAKALQIEKVRTNPLFYRQIENTVLRKNCIEYLISHEALGEKFLLSELSDIENTQVLYNDPALETYAAKVKFFEQAFEWNLMSYNFYPFYWANKKNWASLYNVDGVDDSVFRAFLQSGMARVIITIRPGFEEAVNWYMATGQVWNGGQVPTMDNPLYISIIDELRETTGVVEETWESRVPTSLTVIQAGSLGLEVTQALPCDEDCKDYKLFHSDGNPVLDTNGNPKSTNPFVKSNVTLQGIGQEPIKVIPVESIPKDTTPAVGAK
ncbi:hypothetical protein [Flavobacterium sp.]|uniref:hypothetical protein n=1 Tax=Flavobacterium sp. TaxID=239 RepID=UPI00374FF9A9